MLIFLIFIKLHPRGKIKLNKTNGRFPIIISWDFHSKKDRNFFLNIITDFYNRINFPLTILFQFEYTALKQQNNPFHSRNYYSGWDVKFPGNKTGQCCTVHDFGKIHSSTRSNDIIQISWNRNKGCFYQTAIRFVIFSPSCLCKPKPLSWIMISLITINP